MKGILTKREKEIFEMLIINKTTKEIASELNISEKTVRNHISNVMQKLGVNGRASAVVELIKLPELKEYIVNNSIWKCPVNFFYYGIPDNEIAKFLEEQYRKNNNVKKNVLSFN